MEHEKYMKLFDNLVRRRITQKRKEKKQTKENSENHRVAAIP